jgi:CRISPR/Cas system-associated exonuclease Cas4 (RecB family)
MSHITWSFSSLKDYVNCPRQYYEVKVAKNYVKSATQQMLYGTAVHEACENYVRDGTPLPPQHEQFKPTLDALLEIPGDRYPEYKMALDVNFQPCDFFGDYWVRGIADLLIVDDDAAYVVDYKTGSNKYPDPKQLKLMALMVFAQFPKVNIIRAALLFIVYGSIVAEVYTRDQVPELWGAFRPDLQRLQGSFDNNVWNPNSTPLCRWCPVKTCEHNND